MKLVGNRPHSCLARSCDAVLRTKSLGQNVRSQCWGGNVGWIAPMTKSTPRMSAALMHLCAVRNKTFNQFENTNAHQWTPCMEGSIFFAPTTQITNLYFCPIRFCYDAKSILNQLIFSLSLQKPAQLRMRSPFILYMIKTTHIEYSSVGKLLQAWPLVACLYSKPKTMNRFSSPRCMLLIQPIQVWDKKRVE